MCKLGKYILWSSIDGSTEWIFAVSLTTRPAYLMINGGIRLLYMLGTDKEFLNMIT